MNRPLHAKITIESPPVTPPVMPYQQPGIESNLYIINEDTRVVDDYWSFHDANTDKSFNTVWMFDSPVQFQAQNIRFTFTLTNTVSKRGKHL